ncbi:hypothetical protein FE257_000055 [Aspergillus nanangensis]|uniref:FAD-binding domain-containing protein n=1 Tax=Aspergillus nanangensis TaxID=2582783 RepID=A0AAD4H0X1_ASPNN|nr:hypothetical protein FE257_000055 [Aspergillus nanangensis]
MKVIIAGAGIGGLATAIGLRRAGHDITEGQIFERSSLLRENGAAINVCPNVSPVLREWGFDNDRARMGIARRYVLALGNTLETKQDVEYPDFLQLYGGHWLVAHRVDLHSELKRLATDPDGPGKPAELVLRSEVINYDSEAGSITLADGSIHHGDLVVAADGVHSAAASHVVGHDNPAVSSGLALFRFLISTDELFRDPELVPILKEGFTKIEDGVMRTLITEDSIKRMVWFPCANNTIQNFAIYQGDTNPDCPEENGDTLTHVENMISHVQDYHPHIVQIIRKATSVKRWPLLYRDPLPTLTKGQLVIIGDAAHPMLPHQGQGGAQAIEDAAALSVVFADLPVNPSKDEIRRRLVVFDKIRLRRASAFQIISNTTQDKSWKIRERAQQYMPEGVGVPTCPAEFWEHNFGYDILEDSRRHMKTYLEGTVSRCNECDEI